MLQYLRIENVATIESLSVEFSAGLNILTGETGAGKSILIDSINAVSGAKTPRELIRSDASSAFVAALFSGIGPHTADALRAIGVEPDEDGCLQLQRRLFRDGKNACFINGAAVTVSMLHAAALNLVNIHGQRDAQQLLRSESHLGFLDGFAEDGEALDAYRAVYTRLRALKKEADALTVDEGYKARRLDLLTFQIGELEAAGVTVGETDALKKRRAVIRSAVKVTAALNRAVAALVGAEDAVGADALLGEALGSVEAVTDVVPDLRGVSDSLEDVRETVLDAASVLEDALDQLGGSEAEIDGIEERLDVLTRLSKKYGGSEEAMLAFLADARAELDALTFSGEKLERLSAEYDETLAEARKLAVALSKLRRAAGKRLSAAVENELRELDMPHVRFCVMLADAPLSDSGADAAEFLISANPGEDPKPLSKVASGGELSRVMLALKTVLNDAADATLIFDEIDTGVSGSAAGRIGEKLRALAGRNQVLCITHSAQIAAKAAAHIFLYKTVENGRTFTRLRALDEAQRAAELARITFGEDYSAVQLASAQSLLAQNQN